MTTAEQVTNFVLRRDHFDTPIGSFSYRGEAVTALAKCDLGPECIAHRVEMSPIKALVKALNEHLKSNNCEPEEYGFNFSDWQHKDGDKALIPQGQNWLVAFAVEGSNEGYYVHVGVMTATGAPDSAQSYKDFALAKTYSPESAYALAREAQRFLTAAAWN